ncbi:hypothetical protein BLX24_14450 [Arsenicibacter rosenii]|uniref:Uncharacterized protein n=2 Tax=Arsenicibacter rosenii TaxID=1750698 RepID=A0A1S2VJ14_9BACT|nr:hypothetical protein BLX24_14450 [Arsenicibacter rosenii]
MYTALTAQNVLVGVTRQAFNSIQLVKRYFLVLSGQGKIDNRGNGVKQYQPAFGGCSVTTVTSSNAGDKLHQLQEMPHSERKKWMAMQIAKGAGYAADDVGQGWCWGEMPPCQRHICHQVLLHGQ